MMMIQFLVFSSDVPLHFTSESDEFLIHQNNAFPLSLSYTIVSILQVSQLLKIQDQVEACTVALMGLIFKIPPHRCSKTSLFIRSYDGQLLTFITY